MPRYLHAHPVRVDPRKERRNKQKHGVGFDKARTVFADTLSITIPDPDHSRRRGALGYHGLLASPAGCWSWYTRRRMSARASRIIRRVGPTRTSGGCRKKAARNKDDMRDYYDFRGGVRGKYAARIAEGTNVVVLDPDVARMFPDGNQSTRPCVPSAMSSRCVSADKPGRTRALHPTAAMGLLGRNRQGRVLAASGDRPRSTAARWVLARVMADFEARGDERHRVVRNDRCDGYDSCPQGPRGR